MYEAIIVLNYMVYKKTQTGNVASYNNTEKHVKIIKGVSEADCIEKVNEFLDEHDFKSLKGQEFKK